MRHRTMCLSGNTIITFNKPAFWKKKRHENQKNWKNEDYTLEYLYNRWNKNDYCKKRIKNMLIRVYDEKEKKYIVSNIENVICNGEKEFFQIELESGKKLTLTKDHKVMTKDGWKELQDAINLNFNNNIPVIGKECEILVNGIESPWRSYDWMKNEREKGYSVSEIAEHAGCSYFNIRKWLKIHDLKFNQLDNLSGVNGNPPWNKGIKGYHVNRIVTEEEKEKIRNAVSGEKSHFWKGGVSTKRQSVARWTTQIAHKVHKKYNYTCQDCGAKNKKLNAHHIIPVEIDMTKAYDFNNLISLCNDCHKKRHKMLGSYSRKFIYKGLFGHYEKIIKIKYVGIQKAYDLTIAGDNHNFLANGILVHNCFNEISRRYTEVDMEFYTPASYRTQSKDNKQASNENELVEDNNDAKKTMAEVNAYTLKQYNHLLDIGVCREQARGALPQNMMTTFYCTVNLRNVLHFLKLRMDDHAQWEIRQYANAMHEILKEYYPNVIKAFDEGRIS
ncbi:MAG: FAD-dependent thymidylate synthase [Alphaproteobacteria bacterium]|nr:FAD-dependent thymidylate synthase [Alphaproteobacteria bacterium]